MATPIARRNDAEDPGHTGRKDGTGDATPPMLQETALTFDLGSAVIFRGLADCGSRDTETPFLGFHRRA